MRALVIAAALLGGVVSVSPRAGADAQPTRPVVRVTIAAAAAVADPLEAAVRELLDRLAVDPIVVRAPAIDPAAVVAPEPSPAAAVARIWIDLSVPGVARVYLADAAWERILVRNVPLPKGADEIAREQIAHIVEGAVEALLAGGTIGVTRDEARVELGVPEPPKPQSPPATKAPAEPGVASPKPPPIPDTRTRSPVAPARGTISASVGYEGLAWASGIATHGLAMWATARGAAAPLAPFVSVGGLVRFPLVVDREPIGLRLDTVSSRVVVGVDRALGAAVGLRIGVGGGLDVLRIEPRASGASAVDLTGARTVLAPIARATVGLAGRLSPSSRVALSFVVESDLAPRAYVVRREDRSETVVRAFRFRPGLAISIESDVF